MASSFLVRIAISHFARIVGSSKRPSCQSGLTVSRKSSLIDVMERAVLQRPHFTAGGNWCSSGGVICSAGEIGVGRFSKDVVWRPMAQAHAVMRKTDHVTIFCKRVEQVWKTSKRGWSRYSIFNLVNFGFLFDRYSQAKFLSLSQSFSMYSTIVLTFLSFLAEFVCSLSRTLL